MKRMSLDIEMPLGLGLAMAQHPAAMERFSSLPEEERRAVVEQARSARTKQEMRACVDALLKK